MKSMSQYSDVAMTGGSTVTTISSIVGFITLDHVYMVTAVAGLIIAILGYVDKRRTEKLNRKKLSEDIQNEREKMELERERSQAILDYLKGNEDSPAVHRSPEVIKGVNKVLDDAKG